MRLISFDCGASTGWAVLDVQNDVGNLVAYGAFQIPADQDLAHQILFVRNKTESLIKEHGNIDLLILENFFSSSRFCSGQDRNYYYRGSVLLCCASLDLQYEIVNPSVWKTFIVGRSSPNKEEKAKYGKEEAKKIITVEGLKRRWGIEMPSFSVSERTGKPIKFKYDTSDAVGQVMYGANLRFNTLKFTSSVPIPDFLKKEVAEIKKAG